MHEKTTAISPSLYRCIVPSYDSDSRYWSSFSTNKFVTSPLCRLLHVVSRSIRYCRLFWSFTSRMHLCDFTSHTRIVLSRAPLKTSEPSLLVASVLTSPRCPSMLPTSVQTMPFVAYCLALLSHTYALRQILRTQRGRVVDVDQRRLHRRLHLAAAEGEDLRHRVDVPGGVRRESA